MDLKTKFSRGDAVWALARGRVSRKGEPCTGCADTPHPGKVLVAGSLYECPRCKGKGQIEVEVNGWYISDCGLVACIDVEVNAPDDGWDPPEENEFRDYDRGAPQVIRYGLGRLSERWIGGTLHEESRLVGGSRAAAQTECDRRNEIEGVRERAS